LYVHWTFYTHKGRSSKETLCILVPI